jgi:hypothetical protein
MLVYLSSRAIGAEADELRRALRTKYGLTLDVRDKNWFCERVMESPTRQAAAEELAIAIVDPYLSSAGVGPYVQSTLSTPEAIAAVTFLGLQWRDDVREKGLTRLAFEALVRAAMVGTDSQKRIGRAELYARISRILPGHHSSDLKAHIDSAVHRLGKASVKQWPGDELCLAHDEVQRLQQFRVSGALAEEGLGRAIAEVSNALLRARALPPAHAVQLSVVLRSAVDEVLFERSQAFAMAVHTGTLASLAPTPTFAPP